MPATERPTLDDLRAHGATCSLMVAKDALGVSRATIYRAAQSGEIPTVRVRGRLMVSTDWLIATITGSNAA